MGKSTISGHFQLFFVSLPEGTHRHYLSHQDKEFLEQLEALKPDARALCGRVTLWESNMAGL
jgi:hypothetical protein